MTSATTPTTLPDARPRREDTKARASRRSLAAWAMLAVKPLASLKLTVVLFALSIVLIFAATLAQVDRGIWHVLEVYFKAPVAWVPLSIFVPGGGPATAGGLALPLPGGVVIGGAMLVNLLAAHAVRFKMKARGLRLVAGVLLLVAGVGVIYGFHYLHGWSDVLTNNGLPVLFGLGSLVYTPLVAATALLFGKRLGIVMVHASLILLLVGEGVSAFTREEANLALYEGQTADYAHDVRAAELAVITPAAGDPADSDAGTERVVALPQGLLESAYRDGEAIVHPALPFAIHVELWFGNSTLVYVDDPASREPTATAPDGRRVAVRPLPPASGVGDQMVDLPGAVLRLTRAGETVARVAVSAVLVDEAYRFRRQRVEVAGETRDLVLRHKRVALPARFTLLDFTHDVYPGTNVPKNFASDLRLVNPATNEDRAVNVYMNHPLRYGGLTFFQASYLPDNRGTVLQVVSNPAAELPYIACVVGGLGLAIHFVLSLLKHLGKRRPRPRPRKEAGLASSTTG